MQNHKAYLGGDRPNAVDCMIAPRLYHIQVAMKELKVHHLLSLLPCNLQMILSYCPL